MKTVASDGSAMKRDGHWYGTYGIAVFDGNAMVDWENGFLGRVSDKHRSNEAELQGALKALEYIKENFSDERVELLVDNFSIYEIVKYQIDLEEIGDIKIKQVKRENIDFADLVCDWAWQDTIEKEEKIKLSNFKKTHSERGSYGYKFEPQVV